MSEGMDNSDICSLMFRLEGLMTMDDLLSEFVEEHELITYIANLQLSPSDVPQINGWYKLRDKSAVGCLYRYIGDCWVKV